MSTADSALDRGASGASATSGGPLSVLLADRDEGITVAEQLANNLDVTQFQRIRTSHERSSLIDDRSTPNPQDDTLLLTGTGTARAPVAAGAEATVGTRQLAVDPIGSPGSAGHRTAGGEAPDLQPPPAEDASTHSEEFRGGSPPTGRQGARARSQRVGRIRPDLHEGRPSVPAEDHGGRPRDNRWSELLVSSLNQGYVTASDPGGGDGSGRGAATGGRGAATEGRGDGGRSAAGAGLGDETWVSLNTPDHRYISFFRDIHRKVDPLWQNAFPRDSELQLEQGTCIIGFTLHRDGHVSGVHVRRRSGFPDFDRRVQEALRQAAPFGPIPSSLGVDRLLVTAPFQFVNPLFR